MEKDAVIYQLGYDLAQVLGADPSNFSGTKSKVVKQKQCKKGYRCGGSCISKFKKCRKVLSKQAQKHANWIEKKAKPKLANWTKTKKAEEGKVKQVQIKAKKPEAIEPEATNPKKYDLSSFMARASDFLTQEEKNIFDEYDKLRDDVKSILSSYPTTVTRIKKREKALAELLSKKELADDRMDKAMGNIQKRLQELQGVTDAEVRDAMQNIIILSSAREANPNIEKDVEDYIRLTGFKLENLDTIGYSKPRAFARSNDGFLNVGRASAEKRSRTIAFHELGHFYEFQDEDARKAANQWIREKSSKHNGGRLPEPKKISDLTGVDSYSSDEVAYEDNFTTPYVGKVYPARPGQEEGDTEVLSVGIERFHSPAAMKTLYMTDRSHFDLTLGILISRKSRIEKGFL